MAAARAQAELAARTARCENQLASAQKNLSAGKLSEAYLNLTLADADAVTDALRQRGREFVKQLEEAAAAQLKQADDQFAAGDYAPALKAYRALSQLTRLGAGKQAAQKLAAANKDPKLQAALQEAEAARLYAMIEETLRAKRATSAGDPQADAALIAALEMPVQVRLVQRLELIAKQYAAAPTGRRSDALLKSLQTNTKLMEALKAFGTQDAARQAYSLAQAYREAGKLDVAAEALRKVIRDYPTSDWARKAENELSQIAGTEKK